MLNVEESRAAYEELARPFSELLPWMVQLRDDIILNKDGGLLVCYTFTGVDIEGQLAINSDRIVGMLEHGLRVFDDRITVWWQVDRRRTYEHPDGNFPDEVSRFIQRLRKESFESGSQYSNRHYLSILYKTHEGAGSFLDKVGYFSTDVGHGFLRSVWEATKSSLVKRNAFSFDSAKLDSEIRKFDEMIQGFDETVKDVGLRRLHGDQLLQFMHQRCSPSHDKQKLNVPSIPVYLDGWLTSNTLFVGHDLLLFEDNESAYVAAASVKDWPDMTSPGMLDILLAIPGEITVSQCFRFCDTDYSRKFIQDVQRINLNGQKTLMTIAKEAITGTTSDKVDKGKARNAEDAGAALESITTQNRIFGYYNLTVLSYGKTAVEAETTIKYATQLLRQSGFMVLREKLHLLSAWAGSLPGQWAELVRWFFINTANLSDMAPIRTLASGSLVNEYLTEQTGRHCPALTAFTTSYSIPYYFNFHNGDLAHAVVIGPSRSGKSVFDNFLLSQFRKYHPCRIFIFDKDYSCKINTLMHNGRHIDMTGEGRVKMDPIGFLLGDQKHWAWLVRWLELILTSRDYVFKAEDDSKLWRALENLHSAGKELWCLAGLHPFLSKELKIQLEQWIGNGALSKYFDNNEDDLSVGDWSCVEMGGLFTTPRLATTFLEYAFYRISLTLDGTPTLIYVEEAWFMLEDEQFSKRIDDWLRTLAKKNAFLVMATQSLNELAVSDIFTTIIDNIPNRIFLANANAYAHKDMYMQKFGLNEAQIDTIRDAIPKQDYFIVTPNVSRVVQARFDPRIVGVLRSDSRAQGIFKKHYANREHDADWKTHYLEEVVGNA